MRGKRLLALLLCMVTVFQLVPCAFAEEQAQNAAETPDFSVYAPGEIDIIMDGDGGISISPEDPAIYNGVETKAVAVTGIQIAAGDGWTLVPFNEPFAEDAAQVIGVRLDGADIDAGGLLDLSGQPWVIAAGGKLPLAFNIRLPSGLPREDVPGVLTVTYTFDWAEEDNTRTLTPVDGEHGTVDDKTPVKTDKNGVVQDNLPDVTPEEGFEFEKWADENGNEVKPGDVLTEDITITPVFQVKVPEITFSVEYANGLMLPESNNTATFKWSNAPDDFELAGITSSDPSIAEVSEVFDSVSESQQVEVKAIKRGVAKFTGVSTTGETASFDVLVSELSGDSRPTASIDKTEEVKPGDTINPDDITVEIPTVTPDGGTDTIIVTPDDVSGGEIEEGKNVVSATVDANGVNITINIIINITINQGTPVDPMDHTHTITINPDGGGGRADSSGPLKTDRDGKVPELPTVTPDEGYVFDKWTDEAGDEVKTGDIIDDDVTITPGFGPDENYKVYTITIEPGEHGHADDDRPLKTERGGKVPELPSATPDENFSFDKWVDESGGEVQYGDIIEKDITITPVFKSDEKNRIYTITPVDGEHGIVNDRTPFTTDENGVVSDVFPEVTPDRNYKFSYWVDQDEKPVSAGRVLTKDIILKPTFKLNTWYLLGVSVEDYSNKPTSTDNGIQFPVVISFGGEGGTVQPHGKYRGFGSYGFGYGVSVTISSTEQEGSYGYAIQKITLTRKDEGTTQTIYSTTSPTLNSLTFKIDPTDYNRNEHIGVSATLRKVGSSSISKPNTKAPYVLTPINGTRGKPKSYTPIKTDSNGTVPDRLPETTPDDGYVFERWVNKDGNTVTIGRRVFGDTTITPVFSKVRTCTLIPIDGEHGTADDKTPITTDESRIIPDNFPSVTPEDGYLFDKWVNADSGKEVKPGDVLTEDIIIKPVFHWDPSRPFTISFETANYYTLSDTTPLTATADNKVPMEQMPSVSPIVSHFFDGVWVNVDTNEVVDANTVLTSCITVKPQINCLFTERNGAVTGFSDYAQDKNVESITIPNNIMGKTVTRIGTTAFSAHINHKTDSSGITHSDPNPKAFEVKHVVIEEGITELGKQCFGSYNIFESMNLESISLPNGLKVIGDEVFYECRKLTSITIPDTVTTIGDAAFWDNAALSSVSLGRNVKFLGYRAFMHCTALRSIHLPSSLQTIDGACFEGAGLESVTVPDGCSVGKSAFIFCDNLRYATLGEGTTSLYTTFQRCPNLRTVRLPRSITSINPNAFYYCPNLAYIYIKGASNSVSGAPWGSSQTNPTVIWTS